MKLCTVNTHSPICSDIKCLQWWKMSALQLGSHKCSMNFAIEPNMLLWWFELRYSKRNHALS